MQRFEAPDGVEIVYQGWGTDSVAPPVFLHHGFIADANVNWVAPGVVGALVAAGRRVVALDARGHGRSGKPHDPAFYGEALMARDLGVLFDSIGAERVDLVGYSMGAIVSLIAAARDPRIRRLVAGGVGRAVVELGGVDTRVLSSPDLVAALRADDPCSISHEGAAVMRSFADGLGADREALAAQAASIHASPIPLDRIVAPTLILAGADDPLAAGPEVLAAAIPRARVEIVSGDHLGAVTDPRFAALIVEFLA